MAPSYYDAPFFAPLFTKMNHARHKRARSQDDSIILNKRPKPSIVPARCDLPNTTHTNSDERPPKVLQTFKISTKSVNSEYLAVNEMLRNLHVLRFGDPEARRRDWKNPEADNMECS